MASKNDSSQMRDCLRHQEMASESRAGSSRETTCGSSTKRRLSESSSTEATDLRQRQGTEAQSRDTCGEGKLKREPDCHMQLDKLYGHKKHTVLIDVRALTLIANHKKPHAKLYLLSILWQKALE